MMLSALRQGALFAASNPADAIPIPVVVLTGISLVFAILFILILVVLLEGKIFTSLGKKKNAEAAQEQASPAPVAAPAPTAPAVEAGISPEVVAAIAAAVATASGGQYTLRAVSTSKKGRGQWGLAGVVQSTEPF